MQSSLPSLASLTSSLPSLSPAEEQGIKKIDLLKVDVEGAEISVLKGIKDSHWAMVQQVVLEVENYAARDEVLSILQPKGFTCSWFASEQKRNPGVKSEVCMFYAIRENNSSSAAPAAAAAAAATPPQSSRAERSPSPAAPSSARQRRQHA